ncbi:MAG: glycosyltransferase family 39 protein [Actinomycetota bacterium]
MAANVFMITNVGDLTKPESSTLPDSTALQGGSRLQGSLLLTLTLLGSLLRLHLLNTPMRGDESYTYLHFVSRPLARALTDYSIPNNHLFYTLLAHVSVRLFGNHPWSLRLPALLAGIALIPITFVSLRRLYGDGAALMASGLVASMGTLVDYSTNARGYTIVLCWFLVLVWSGVRILDDEKNLLLWGAFILSIVIGTYTVPSMLFPSVIVAGWLVAAFLFGERRGRFRGFVARLAVSGLITGTTIFALYFPVLHASGAQTIKNAFSWIPHVGSPGAALRVTTSGLVSQWKLDFPIVLLFLLAVGALWTIIRHDRVAKISCPPILLVGVLASGAYVAATRIDAWQRMLIFLLPLFFISGCAGLLALAAKRRRIAPVALTTLVLSIAVVLGLSVVVAHNIENNPETRGSIYKQGLPVATFLAGYIRPTDRVVVLDNHAGQLVVPYYFTELGLGLIHFQACCPANDRILVVAARATGGAHTESWAARFGPGKWSSPHLIRSVGDIGIFELDPLRPHRD